MAIGKQIKKTTIMVFYFIVFIFIVFLFSCQESFACSRDESLLSREIQIKLQQLKEKAHGAGISFKVICTHRSQQEQDELYSQGRTKPGNKVTWTRHSRHIGGEAFDVAIFKGNSISWKGEDYYELGEIGKSLGLVWGGDWKVRDYGHFELDNQKASR